MNFYSNSLVLCVYIIGIKCINILKSLFLAKKNVK